MSKDNLVTRLQHLFEDKDDGNVFEQEVLCHKAIALIREHDKPLVVSSILAETYSGERLGMIKVNDAIAAVESYYRSK
jgi:hypothetical protein